MKIRLAAFSVLAVVVCSLAAAQLKGGAVGLTVSFVQNPNLGLAYALSPHTRLSAQVGFDFTHDSTGNASTYQCGLGIWRYVVNVENIAGFFGGTIGVNASSNSAGTSSSFGIGALYGMEYWFSPRFAVHGTLQVHLSSGKAFGSTVSRVYTTAESGLTWYL